MSDVMRDAMRALDAQDAPTVYPVSHIFGLDVPEQDILDLLDMAGYGIGYWARKATVDEVGKTYTVWLDDPSDVPEEPGKRALQFDWIAKMIVRVAAGDPSLKGLSPNSATSRSCRQYVGSILAGEPDMDLDSADADMIVQLCYFRGEVVYG